MEPSGNKWKNKIPAQSFVISLKINIEVMMEWEYIIDNSASSFWVFLKHVDFIEMLFPGDILHLTGPNCRPLSFLLLQVHYW